MVNDKQFIISKEQQLFSEEWTSIRLKNELILSFEKQLHILTNSDKSVALLGYAWQVDPDGEPVDRIIDNLTGSENESIIYSIEKTWCGRYVLICNNILYLDTIGSLNVFYTDFEISSSVNLLCKINNLEVIYPNIKHGVAPDFIPGEITTYKYIKRLLPSKVINLLTHEIYVRPLLPDGIIETIDEISRIKLIENYYVNSLKQMQSVFVGEKIYLALTSGRDSRAVMALLNKSGLKYEAFTAFHDKISDGDRDIPKELCRLSGVKYRFVERKQFSPFDYMNYREHTAGYAVDEDWNYWGYGQYQQLISKENKDSKGIILLRSSIWEITNSYYKHYCPQLFDIGKVFPNYKDLPTTVESLDFWLESCKKDELNKNINLWDRALWELRSGSWLSALEQAYDMMDGIITIQTCNSRLFLSLLYGFNETDRYNKTHEEKIVQYSCPILNNIPYENTYDGFSYKSRINRITYGLRFIRYGIHIILKALSTCR